jgi:complement component 1 Q subcomponent-binding protein
MFDDGEDIDVQPGGANTKGAINSSRTSSGNFRVEPEDRVAPADRPELDEESEVLDEEPAPAFPARVNVRVTRDGKQGAVMIEATAQDGEIIIENVYYFADAAQADPESSEVEWKRRAVYAGPPFGNLDDELQVLLERYLEERGVDVRLANFIPEYIDFKEQKEYLRWLQSK